MNNKKQNLPLAGYRVVDLTHQVAGPFCTLLLADLGAEVIKIERPPGGDAARDWPIFGPSVFLSMNRNKKSLRLNLSTRSGKDVFRRLVKKSDVFVENMAPGIVEKLGASYSAVRRLNKRMIYCSISGYGKSNPYSNLPAWDPVIQALSGLMSITGEEEGAPVRIGTSVVDMGSGLFAALGILSKIIAGRAERKGAFLDISLFDSATVWMTFWVTYYSLLHKLPKRLGSSWPAFCPYQAFRTLDGFGIKRASNEDYWRAACQALSLDFLIDDARFATNKLRLKHSPVLVKLIEGATSKLRRRDIIAKLRRYQVPCAPVNNVSELSRDQVLMSRHMIERMSFRSRSYLSVANPLKASQMVKMRSKAPPLLGQDSAEILRTLGYSEQELKEIMLEN